MADEKNVQRVVITGVQMEIWDLAKLLMKLVLAAIPAVFILSLAVALFFVLFAVTAPGIR